MVVHSETDNGYFESLDWQGKRYKEKLETVGLSLQDYPYCLDERFSSDMTSWPKIEYGHIFAYFITRPSTYTQQELVSNYFGSGYVRTVLCLPFGKGKARCVVVKAQVNVPQTTPMELG